MISHANIFKANKILYERLTITVESLAAKAMISAQDTVLGQCCSSADLISSKTSNPRAELRFGLDRFSLTICPVLSSNTDASQP